MQRQLECNEQVEDDNVYIGDAARELAKNSREEAQVKISSEDYSNLEEPDDKTDSDGGDLNYVREEMLPGAVAVDKNEDSDSDCNADEDTPTEGSDDDDLDEVERRIAE